MKDSFTQSEKGTTLLFSNQRNAHNKTYQLRPANRKRRYRDIQEGTRNKIPTPQIDQ